jgi:hypothetical protein
VPTVVGEGVGSDLERTVFIDLACLVAALVVMARSDDDPSNDVGPA